VAYIYSSNEQAAAVAAGNAAADGQREATYLAYWQSALGPSPSLALYRSGTKVWSASISGSLPIDGTSFVVPTTVTTISIADADIDTGTWEFRVENTSNADVYIGAGVTKTGATDVLALSDDIDDATEVTVGEIAFTAPSLDTVTQVISRNDSRVVMWMDPNYTFANQLHGYGLQINTSTNGQTVWSVSEPGVLGSGSSYTLSRVTSPYSDGTSFLHRISPTFPLWGDTQRSQYVQHTKLLEGVTYWMGFEFSVESSWATAGDSFTLGDIHHNSWTVGPYGVLPGVHAPLNFHGQTTPAYAISCFGNYTPGSGGETGVTLYTSGTLSAGDRVRLILRFRLGRSWADSPFVQVWAQLNAGAETQIVDRADVMIGFADAVANECYCKMGLYAWTPSAPERTTYSKGVVLLREEGGVPTLTAGAMFDLVQSL